MNEFDTLVNFRMTGNDAAALRRFADELGLSLSELLRLLIARGLESLLAEDKPSDSAAAR